MLEYRIQKALLSGSQSPAGIFLLHGYGSHADDLFSFAPYLPKNHTIIALQAPLNFAPYSYAWYPLQTDKKGNITSSIEEAWQAVQLIIENIKELIKIHDLNAEDISLLGFSQGAILSWAIAYQQAIKIRRIMALSGLVHESINTQQPPEFLAYASHGVQDPVIPILSARESIIPLSEKYTTISYNEFNDGHTVSRENFQQLLEWIEKTNL